MILVNYTYSIDKIYAFQVEGGHWPSQGIICSGHPTNLLRACVLETVTMLDSFLTRAGDRDDGANSAHRE
jgi:hypothetical protein